ncbi:MAG: hypothetical protein FWF80_04975 [Defluviitaleaceae bacterium]|nr:hypothetical protein [Defluviitaleaceae bacterium]
MTALSQAQEIADQILARAKKLVFTGDKEQEETELDAYMEFLDEHASLIDELTDLKLQLDEDERSSAEFKKIIETIEEITAIYKKHVRLIEHLHKNAKASYKEVKQGQRLNAGYNPLSTDEVSSKFDFKQ